MDIFVARQPIFSRQKKLFAYELLHRGSMKNVFPGTDGDKATSSVLVNTFLSIGLDKLVGPKWAFINFTEQHLLAQTPVQFPPEKVIVEILEHVLPTPEIINGCKQLKENGYILALDDFIAAARGIARFGVGVVVALVVARPAAVTVLVEADAVGAGLAHDAAHRVGHKLAIRRHVVAHVPRFVVRAERAVGLDDAPLLAVGLGELGVVVGEDGVGVEGDELACLLVGLDGAAKRGPAEAGMWKNSSRSGSSPTSAKSFLALWTVRTAFRLPSRKWQSPTAQPAT